MVLIQARKWNFYKQYDLRSLTYCTREGFVSFLMSPICISPASINFVIRNFTRGEKVPVMSFSGYASSFNFKCVQVVLELSFKHTACHIFVLKCALKLVQNEWGTSICLGIDLLKRSQDTKAPCWMTNTLGPWKERTYSVHCEFAAKIIYLFTSLLNLLLGLYLYFVFPCTVILLHQLKFTRTNFHSVMPLLFHKGCRNQSDG